jgi:hypothetical protein
VTQTTTPAITIGGVPIAASSPGVGQIAMSMLPNPTQAAPTNIYTCQFARFDAVVKCLQTIEGQFNDTLHGSIQSGWESICTAQIDYLALQRQADEMLSRDSLGTVQDRLSADKDFERLIGPNLASQPDEQLCSPRGSMIAIRGTESGPSTMVSVATTSATISRVKPYPISALANEAQELSDVLAALKAFTASRIDAETKADESSVLAECSLASLANPNQPLSALQAAVKADKAKSDAALKSAQSATPTNAPQLITKLVSALQKYSQDNNELAALTTALNNANADLCQNLTADYNTNNVGTGGQAKLNKANADAAALQARLATYGASSAYAGAYATAVSQLQTLQAVVLSNVNVGRFYVTVPEDCTDLFGGSRSTTITVQRSPGQQNSIIVDCPSRVFTSEGFAFSFIPQGTYAAVASNSAIPQAPSGSPTPPPATVEQTAYSDVRPIPVVLLNVRFSAPEPNDNGLYMSFGISLNSSSISTQLDYLAGLSYSLSRSLIFTAGASISPQNVLLPGYQVGQPIAAGGGSPPTTTHTRIAPFLAITYGAH